MAKIKFHLWAALKVLFGNITGASNDGEILKLEIE